MKLTQMRERQVEFAKFAKDYYEKTPQATGNELVTAFHPHMKLYWSKRYTKNIWYKLLRAYRYIQNDDKFTNSSVDEITQHYPFYTYLHAALKFSLFYKSRDWKLLHDSNDETRIISDDLEEGNKSLVDELELPMNKDKQSFEDDDAEWQNVVIKQEPMDLTDDADTHQITTESNSNDNSTFTTNNHVNDVTSQNENMDNEASRESTESAGSCTSDEQSFTSSESDKEDLDEDFFAKGTGKSRKSTSRSVDLTRLGMDTKIAIAKFLKSFLLKNPQSSRSEVINAVIDEFKNNFAAYKLRNFTNNMITIYRNCFIINYDSEFTRSGAVYKQHPFLKEMEDAFKDNKTFFVRGKWKKIKAASAEKGKGKRGRKSVESKNERTDQVVTPRKSERIASQFVEETRQSSRPRRLSLEPIPMAAIIASTETAEKEMSSDNLEISRMPSTRQRPSNSQHDEQKPCGKKFRRDNEALQHEIMRILKDIYILNPKETMANCCRTMAKLLNSRADKLKSIFKEMLRKYREFYYRRVTISNISIDSIDAELIANECPFFHEMSDVLNCSDYYKTIKWKPGRFVRKCVAGSSTMEVENHGDEKLDSSTESEIEMATTESEENTCARTSWVMNKNKLHIEQRRQEIMHKEPLVLLERTSSEKIMKETLKQVKKGTETDVELITEIPKQKEINTQTEDIKSVCQQFPVEFDVTNIKTEEQLNELKLYQHHQLEMNKLLDRKDERQFQLDMMKLQHDHEIAKLKLEIELEKLRAQRK